MLRRLMIPLAAMLLLLIGGFGVILVSQRHERLSDVSRNAPHGPSLHRTMCNHIEFDDRHGNILVSSLANASGAAAGRLIVLNDTLAREAAHNWLTVIAAGATLVLLVALSGFLFVMLRRADADIGVQRKELRKSEQHLAATLRSIGDGVITCDGQGRVTSLNRVAEKLTGWSTTEAAGRPLDEVFRIVHAQTRQTVDNPVARALAEGVNVDLANRTVLIAREGTERHIADSCAPIRDAAGAATGAVLVFRDVTKHYEREWQLRRFRAALDASADDLFIINRSTMRFVDVNDTACNSLGYARDELLSMGPQDIKPHFTREALAEEFDRVLGGEPVTGVIETIHARKDGTQFPVEVCLRGLDQDGTPLLVASVRDITERQQAKKALRESESLLARAEEIAHLGSWKLNLLANCLGWSDEVYRLFGCKPQEFAATYEAFLDFVHPDDRDAVDEAYSGSLADGTDGYEIKHRIIRKDTGEIRYVHEQCIHERDASGAIIQSIGMVQDITARKRAEDALRKNLQRLEFALQGGELGMWDWNPQDNAVAYNDLWANMLEYRPDEVEPTVEFFKQHVHPEDLAAVLDRLTGHIEGRLPIYESEHRLRTKSGRWLWVLDRGKIAERDKDGRPVRVTGLIADITERKHSEEALRESEDRFMNVLYASDDAILLIADNTFIDCNEATVSLLGYDSREQLHQTHPSELSPETQPDGRSSREKADEMMQIAFDRGFHRFEWIHRRPNGEDFPVEVSLTPIVHEGKRLLYCVWRDIAERKRAEGKVRQLAQAVEQSPATVVITDPEGSIVYANPKFESTTGYLIAEALGQNPRILKAGELAAESYAEHRNVEELNPSR